MKSQTNDPVNNPAHYTQHRSGIECIQVTEHMNFCLGNAMKYLWRAGSKGDAIEDLKKAAWYIEREIQRLSASHQAPFVDAPDDNRDDNKLRDISLAYPLGSVWEDQSKRLWSVLRYEPEDSTTVFVQPGTNGGLKLWRVGPLFPLKDYQTLRRID